jgi:hypothetical protein
VLRFFFFKKAEEWRVGCVIIEVFGLLCELSFLSDEFRFSDEGRRFFTAIAFSLSATSLTQDDF